MDKRQFRIRREFLKLGIYLLMIYALIGIGIGSPIYTCVVLRPSVGISEEFRGIDHILSAKKEEFFFENYRGEKLHGWLFRRPEKGKIVVVHHGNAGNIVNRLFLAKYLIASGASVFLYDYRGYGLSQGRPALGGLLEDGLTAHDFVLQASGYSPADVVIYGESIGSGVACHVASLRPHSGLILQSGICSLPAVAKDDMLLMKAYPVSLFPKPHFDNLSLIDQLSGPILIIHGMKDKLVPFKQSQELFVRAANPKWLVLLPHAGHNDVGDQDSIQFLDALQDFFKRLRV
jgi:fermentation-respiration switch protein FrsA (DUF1100 family)